jgi:hypothetical protein
MEIKIVCFVVLKMENAQKLLLIRTKNALIVSR